VSGLAIVLGGWLGASLALAPPGVEAALREGGQPQVRIGLRPTVALVWDGSTVVRSGVGERATAGRARMDAGLEIELAPALWRVGIRAYAGVLALRGRNGSGLAGEFQPHSGNDADPFEEFVGWIETSSSGERFRLRAGRMDANEEFGAVESAAPFLNASAGLTPVLERLPTYPTPTAGLHAVVGTGRGWQVAAGVHDSVPGDTGTFSIGEVRRNWSGSGGGRAAAGAWSDGVYALAEQAWNPTGAIGSVRAFAQFGRARPRAATFDRHAAAGLVVEGFGPRTGDAAGVLATRVTAPDPVVGPARAETVTELFYRARVTPWLAVQPDLQRIAGPVGGADRRDRWIAAVRIEIVFGSR